MNITKLYMTLDILQTELSCWSDQFSVDYLSGKK